MSWLSVAIAKGALGAWMMDEASGTVAADGSGHSRTMALNGSVTPTATALMPTGSRCFDFAGGFLECVNDSAMNSASFSVEAWINADATSSYRGIWSKDGTSPRGPSFYVTGGKLNLFNGSDNLGGTTLSTGTNYHAVATYDSATTTVKLYLNAVVDGTITTTVDNTPAWNMMWGASRAGGFSAAFPFDGKMGPGAFYATALSGADVSALYAAGTTASPDATINPPVATASASAPVPVVSASSVVASPVASASASAPVPAIDNGLGSATVAPPAAMATASAPAPVITQVYAAGTDTSNSLNGRRRRARGSVVVTRPAAATPARAAVKYDKSVPLPPPVLVDGRLT